LCQWQYRKGIKPGKAVQNGGRGADRRPIGVFGDQVAVGAVAHQHDGDKGKAQQTGKEDQLKRAVTGTEKFHQHVMGGINAKGGQRQQRTAQV
jgi:hypothetical protein